jgi:hypothetical protein
MIVRGDSEQLALRGNINRLLKKCRAGFLYQDGKYQCPRSAASCYDYVPALFTNREAHTLYITLIRLLATDIYRGAITANSLLAPITERKKALLGLLVKRRDAIMRLHTVNVVTGSTLTRGLVLTLLLSACGGGSGSGAATSAQVPANLPKPTEAVSPLPVQTPRSADSFVDAIGVNTHIGYGDTAYVSAWSQIQSLLIASGIRHVRDGVNGMTQTSYADLNALGAAGIHADLLTTIGQSTSTILAFPSIIPSMEAYEGPNEHDISGDPNWASNLTAFQQLLYSTVRGNAATSQYPVIGPSLTSESAFIAVGNISGSQSYGNLHVGFAGRNPGTVGWGATDSFGEYGSLPYNIALGKSISGSESLIVTETGYDDDSADTGYVPSPVKVRYTLRTLLECWNAGILRTYLYNFLDEGGRQYGLLDSAANAKPVYYAVKNLIAALTDAGPSFATTPLPYGVTGVPTIHQALFQKRDGSYVLALWHEVPSWNPITNAVQTVAPETVTLSFSTTPTGIGAATFGDAGTLVPSSIANTSGSAYSLVVSDGVTLVTIKP